MVLTAAGVGVVALGILLVKVLDEAFLERRRRHSGLWNIKTRLGIPVAHANFVAKAALCGTHFLLETAVGMFEAVQLVDVTAGSLR